MKLQINNFKITGTNIMYFITFISIISSIYLGYLKYTDNSINTETLSFSIIITLLNLYLIKR